MDSRLDELAPELAAVLHGLPAARLRRIAEVACSLALAVAELDDPRADAAFARLRRGRPGDGEERAAVRTLAGELDLMARSRQASSGRGSGPGGVFARARAATALWCALGAEPLQAVLDCLYEVHFAGVDLDTLRSVTSTASG